MSFFFVQLLVALVCAAIANMLLPRQIPGKSLGYLVTGLVGVWLGGFLLKLVAGTFRVVPPVLGWNFYGVPLIPSVIGAFVVIWLTTEVWERRRYL